MKTRALGVVNLCVPCAALCRYCLLDSCRKSTGVSYERGKAFAKRMDAEIKKRMPDLTFFYYIGYCMDTPYLMDYVQFCRSMGYPSGSFLQMNGFRFREKNETRDLFQALHAAGLESVDFTFYGTRDDHDAFAGRKGDFDLLLSMLQEAERAGIASHISAPLLKSNIHTADVVLQLCQYQRRRDIHFFLPHSKGRGKGLADERITKADFELLSPAVKAHFSKVPHLTEAEWLAMGKFDPPSARTLTLNLSPDEMERWESMTAEEILRFLQEMDDQYQAALPSPNELAAQYGDSKNHQLFRQRDLLLKWQQMYIWDHPSVYDMHDETHHFSAYS